ncbi:polysaccharide biosynthesis protein [Piscinibacter sp.]|uniref:polysaccharide biosynthesis protein n=1 Tax=Piscinibacter sp. TaxID=1903157 RepID=UPI0039E2F6EC
MKPTSMFSQLTRLPPVAKSLLIVAADVVVLPFALWCAIALRLGSLPPVGVPKWWVYALTLLITLPIFLHLGLYRAVIRYLETRAFLLVIGASLGAAAVFSAIALALGFEGVPGTSLVIYAVFSAAYAALARLLARQLLRGAVGRAGHIERAPLAIYGAGAAGRQLAQALRASSEFRPEIFVDDAPALHGRTVMGLRVFSPAELPPAIEQHDIRTVVVAIPSLSPGRRAELLRRLEPLHLEVRLVPGMADLIRNEVGLADIRRVRPEDLLGRDAVHLDTQAMHRFLADRVVMVTGAGGSIGSELCRQILHYRPSRLVLFEISEPSLYTLREELVALAPSIVLVCAIGDVKNASRVDAVLQEHRPAVVFHAAAYKHVPLMEEINAWEAVRNNTLGTYVIGQAAIRHGVERFVLVSTDKAVNPTNVMGASKRLAEMVCQALNGAGGTHFGMVRFGNVLGSSGSVIPKFRDQIVAGGPVTVTHPDIVRYFMSIPEAAQLVLQAACMGQGGEVFVLDMGEPVKIVDLARNMIRLSGFSEDQIRIEFTGLRPGEKLFEELLADSEFTRPTHHPKIRIARVAGVDEERWSHLREWVVSDGCFDDDAVRRRMAGLLPEYKPWQP